MSVYNKEKLAALFSKWERILEKEGLPDLENKNGLLRVRHNGLHWVRREASYDPDKNAAKEAYYQLAGEFLYTHEFENAKERRIWELHSQGMPVRQIAKAVRQPRNWSQINKTIVQLRKVMLSRTFLP